MVNSSRQLDGVWTWQTARASTLPTATRRPHSHHRDGFLNLRVEQSLLDGLPSIDQRPLRPLSLVQQQCLLPLLLKLLLPLLGQVPLLGEFQLRLELVVAGVEGKVVKHVGG